MNFFGRPKWKNPDPQIRLQAVARLNDDAVLAELALTDENAEVRRAAAQRISDEERLAELAQENTDVNLAALDRLKEQRLIVQVARRAESADVRCRAVGRIEDPLIVQRISAEDTCPTVRRLAKARLVGPNNMWLFLKAVLTKLEVAQLKALETAENCADLDGICDTLAKDSRFHIHGVVGEVIPPTEPKQATVVELLANSVDDPETTDTLKLSSYYHIEIRRTGENAFGLKVNQRESTPPFAVTSATSASR